MGFPREKEGFCEGGLFLPFEIGRACRAPAGLHGRAMLEREQKACVGCVGPREPSVSFPCARRVSDPWLSELCDGSHHRLGFHRISAEEK